MSYGKECLNETLAKPADTGKGLCPKCGARTIKKLGKHGYFYGCTKFPACTGARFID